MNKRVHEVLRNRFEAILDTGALPKVQWKPAGQFKSYSLFEYSENWSKFVKAVDEQLKAQGEEGVFTRKWSKVVLDKIQKVCDNIGEAEILAQTTRFKTWFD